MCVSVCVCGSRSSPFPKAYFHISVVMWWDCHRSGLLIVQLILLCMQTKTANISSTHIRFKKEIRGSAKAHNTHKKSKFYNRRKSAETLFFFYFCLVSRISDKTWQFKANTASPAIHAEHLFTVVTRHFAKANISERTVNDFKTV